MNLLYHLEVNNDCSPGNGWCYLANDDELNHVDMANAGKFTSDELARTVDYIVGYVDGNSKFQITPATS